MKTLSLIIAIVTFSSCQFNKSVNTDLMTGAFSNGDGIGIDAIDIEINGTIEKRNEFVFGEKVNFIFHNVSGLTKEQNKVYPGLSMHIVKNEKDTVYSSSNLAISLKNGTDLIPLQLNASFTTALPYKNNEKYNIFIEIWDHKGDGKFNYELPITIKENDFINIKNNGIEYSNIYLWNETLKQVVLDKNISFEHQFILILDDIEGLELKNEKVFPVFSVDLIDNSGNKILSHPNILSNFETTGVNPLDLKKQLTASITLSKGKINNPCRLIAKLKDKNSPKEIIITTEVHIN